MEFVKELLPFILGLVISPLIMMAFPKKWSERVRFIASFVLAVVVGFIASTIVGEQFGELEERLVALVIDTSTAYAGASIGYWLFWKAIVDWRMQPKMQTQPK